VQVHATTVLALLLMKQFAELVQQPRQVGPEPVAPVLHAGIGDGQETHEQVRAADAVPAGVAGEAGRFLKRLQRLLAEQIDAELAAGKENVFLRVVGHDGGFRSALAIINTGALLIMADVQAGRKRGPRFCFSPAILMAVSAREIYYGLGDGPPAVPPDSGGA
jgi:hypothetical protein